MRAKKWKLNPDKTEAEAELVGGSQDQVDGRCPAFDGVTFPLKGQVRSLGVLLYPLLFLEAWVASVVQSGFHQIQLVAPLHPCLDRDNLTSADNTLLQY